MESRIEMMKPSKADDDMEKHFKPSLEMMFHAIDLNGDGIISLPEWKIYYKAMGIHDDKKAEESFKVVDLNSDGDMSLEEFIAGSCDFLYTQDVSPNMYFLGPLQEL